MQPSNRVRAAALAVGAALALAACAGGHADTGPDTAAHRGGTSAASTAPSGPARLTDRQYRAVLSAADRPLSAALAKLADTPADRAGSALTTAAAAAERSRAALAEQRARTPAKATAGNAGLAGALGELADALRDRTGGDEGCEAADPVAGLSGDPAVTAVSAATKSLAAQGYPAALAVPAFRAERHRSLATGTFLRSGSRTGEGRLTVENGGDTDAVVSLRRSGSAAFSVYLRKGGSDTVHGLRDGSYTVYFESGSDWDSAARGFTRDCSFQRFDDSLRYTTSYGSTEIRYTTYTLTLYAVAGGTAAISQVPAGSFPAP